MRKILFIICLSFSFISLHAQITNEVFVGAVTTADKQTYSYKIQISDSNGVLTGYSITDVMGPDETKTLLKGTVNAAKKTIRFKETRVVYSKSKSPDLCFLSGTLKISSKKGTTVLKGTFTGKKSDGATECASGNMALISGKDIMSKLLNSKMKNDTMVDKISKVLAADNEPQTEKVVYQTEDAVPESKIMKVTPGSTKELICPGTNATLTVWDARTIDGDIITITQNGAVILDKYTLRGIYKDINVHLRENMSDTIKVIAINEGTEPLNTARMKITSGSMTQYIDASTTMDKPIWIVLKKK